MYIIRSISRITGYTCQGTHAFPTKKLAEKWLDIIGMHKDINYCIINAPEDTPLLDIKTSINMDLLEAYSDNSNDETLTTIMDNFKWINCNLIDCLNQDLARIQYEIT